MKKLIVIVMSIFLIVPYGSFAADPFGEDRNCSDFKKWEDAQAFFESVGGPEMDPHDLDRDGNGLVCERLK